MKTTLIHPRNIPGADGSSRLEIQQTSANVVEQAHASSSQGKSTGRRSMENSAANRIRNGMSTPSGSDMELTEDAVSSDDQDLDAKSRKRARQEGRSLPVDVPMQVDGTLKTLSPSPPTTSSESELEIRDIAKKISVVLNNNKLSDSQRAHKLTNVEQALATLTAEQLISATIPLLDYIKPRSSHTINPESRHETSQIVNRMVDQLEAQWKKNSQSAGMEERLIHVFHEEDDECIFPVMSEGCALRSIGLAVGAPGITPEKLKKIAGFIENPRVADKVVKRLLEVEIRYETYANPINSAHLQDIILAVSGQCSKECRGYIVELLAVRLKLGHIPTETHDKTAALFEALLVQGAAQKYFAKADNFLLDAFEKDIISPQNKRWEGIWVSVRKGAEEHGFWDSLSGNIRILYNSENLFDEKTISLTEQIVDEQLASISLKDEEKAEPYRALYRQYLESQKLKL